MAIERTVEKFAPNNRLLAALPRKDFLSLRPHLESVPLKRGSVLYDVDEPVARVYFVETGIILLHTTFQDRAIVGIAAVGREGAVDAATLLLGGDSAPGRFQVLVPGSALAVEASSFRSALHQSPRLRIACGAYASAFLVQTLQAVACTKLHTVEQRCAYWLLMCSDRTEDKMFELAPGCLAEALGVPESTEKIIAGPLQQKGLIRYDHGAITVLDRPGLETVGCECYRIVRDRCERLLIHAGS